MGTCPCCLCDVTTLYFEAEHEDGLRKVGFSKERRVDPQVIVGMLTDRTGLALQVGCWEGNKAGCCYRNVSKLVTASMGRTTRMSV